MSDPTDTRVLEFIEEDGKPLGETGLHAEQAWYLLGALKTLFHERGEDDVYVGGNQFFYWDPTDPRRCVVPDIYVVRGLEDPRRVRRSFELWQERCAPCLIIELASRATWGEDLGYKKDVYREVFQTSEYVMFDPEEDILDEGPLLAWRLAGRSYRRVGTARGFESRVLGGVRFEVLDGLVRLVDDRGRLLPGLAFEGHEAGLREGRESGLREGHESGLREGHERGQREAVARVLEARFGRLEAGARARLVALSGPALQEALTLAATVPAPDDLWRALRGA